MGTLAGKVIAISGGARGQGAAEARLFITAGAKVFIGDVLEAEGQDLAATLGPDAYFQRLDVSREDDWISFIDLARRTAGRLDGLINNAGIMRYARLDEVDIEDILSVFKVNQLGVMLGIKHAVPLIKQSGGGSIINVSSSSGLRTFVTGGAYAATKWAVRGITRVAALELASSNIRVNAILPGYIRTPMTEEGGEQIDTFGRSMTPMNRAGTSEEVADLAEYLLSDRSSYVSGADFSIDGAATC